MTADQPKETAVNDTQQADPEKLQRVINTMAQQIERRDARLAELESTIRVLDVDSACFRDACRALARYDLPEDIGFVEGMELLAERGGMSAKRMAERDAKVARLVGLLRQQVSRLWAYHDWVGEHDCATTSREDGFETARITITRRLTPAGDDQTGFYVSPSDLALVETLGLLRLAEDTAITDAQR